MNLTDMLLEVTKDLRAMALENQSSPVAARLIKNAGAVEFVAESLRLDGELLERIAGELA